MKRNELGQDWSTPACGDHYGGTWAVPRPFPSPPTWSQIPMLLLHSLAVNTWSVISIKTLEVNLRQMSVCQAVPKMQSCKEWMSFHSGVCRTCCELMDSLQPGFLSAVDSLNPEKTINMPAKWRVCRRVCWPVFERMLNLDVFSTSLPSFYRWNWFLLH